MQGDEGRESRPSEPLRADVSTSVCGIGAQEWVPGATMKVWRCCRL